MNENVWPLNHYYYSSEYVNIGVMLIDVQYDTVCIQGLQREWEQKRKSWPLAIVTVSSKTCYPLNGKSLYGSCLLYVLLIVSFLLAFCCIISYLWYLSLSTSSLLPCIDLMLLVYIFLHDVGDRDRAELYEEVKLYRNAREREK